MGEQRLVPDRLPEELTAMLGGYLSRQRWYAGKGEPASVTVQDQALVVADELVGGRLLWAVVEADGDRYQLLVGERPVTEVGEHLRGHEDALIGTAGDRAWYDAVVDSEMAIAFLHLASGGAEDASRARPLSVEQSNTSVVYDDRLILKLFRRLSGGENPDAEVTSALAATGFSHVAAPLVRWRRNGADLAFGQQFLAGGTDGWALALTSLRDLYGSASTSGPYPPGASGGDFAAEAARLGQMTAEMHLAMADAFGTSDETSHQWPSFVSVLEQQAELLVPALVPAGAGLFRRLHQVRDPGPAVRAHGDYHLGQVMRTDAGWYVLDFEGEPNRPLEERLRPTSVLKDVAGMLRSLQYAPQFVLWERADSELPVLDEAARAWQRRNCNAFLTGYYDCKGIEQVLPPTPQDREAVRVAFELDKALYELGYERAYRPDWAAIPQAALEHLLSSPAEELVAPPGKWGNEGEDDPEDDPGDAGQA